MPDPFAASDEELIDRHRRLGDGDALGTLLDRHLARLRRLLVGMIADRTEVDDLVQEVFLRVIRGLPGFKQEARFSTWLYRVAMNTAYRYIERQGRRQCECAAADEPLARRGDEPGTRAVGAEMNRQIAAALGELSPPLRAAVMLMAVDGLSGNEAAAIEGCAPATMYWRLHEARKILAERLRITS